MPGIAVLIGESAGARWDALRAASAPIARMNCLRIGGRHCVGIMQHLGAFNHHVYQRDETTGVGLVLDGWILPSADWRPGEDACDYCWRRFREDGIEFIAQLNGSFNLLAWDDRRGAVYWATDRHATRPSYCGAAEGTLCIAPRAAAVLAGLGRQPSLNRQRLVNQLVYNQISSGDSTLFDGVRAVRAATIVRWQGNQVSHRAYWDYLYDPVETVDDAFVDTGIAVAQAATADHLALAQRPALSLSGGLDSRAMLAAVAGARRPTLHSYTWGPGADYDEVRLAGQTAAAFQTPWHFLPLTPADFLSRAAAGVHATDGLDVFVQCYAETVYPQIAQNHDALLTGLGLEYTFGGRYVPENLLTPDASEDHGLDYVLRAARTLAPADTTTLIDLPDFDDLEHALHQDIAADYGGGSALTPADRVTRYFVRQRGRKMLFLRPTWFRDHLEHIYPIFDNRWIDFALRIPASWRARDQFYQRFLVRLHPDSAAIPYQHTLLPVTAPIATWKTAKELEAQREDLLRKVFHFSNGAVFLPYKRYYSNFDEWLRLDADWRTFTDDLLLNRDSLIFQGIVRPEATAALLAEHRSAARAHHARLIQLMSLELFLRAFFPSGVA